jgi:beta-glucosidase
VPLLGPNPSTVKLGWVTPAESASLIPAAVAAAKRAGTAIVFAYDDESEGIDRSTLSLTGSQNELISQVAKANPNTIVVLNTGSAVTMPWLGSVRSVLDMWYPGQDGAEASAALLFGDAAPGGRLTQTFPASENQTPVAGDPARFPGVGGQVDYAEGIDVGYRWYDAHHVTPLFPFGFGLTYTTFAYRDLAVRPAEGGGLDVSFTVRNTGSRTGDAVPQVYVGPSPNVGEPQAVRSLAGYDKITLRPGERRRVDIHLAASQLSYWNTTSNGWALGTGNRAVFVGSSSADLPLRTTVDVR